MCKHIRVVVFQQVFIYTNRQWAAWVSGHSCQSQMLRAPLDPGAPETHHATSSQATHLHLPQLHSGVDLCKWAPSAEQVRPAGVGKVKSEGHILSWKWAGLCPSLPNLRAPNSGLNFCICIPTGYTPIVHTVVSRKKPSHPPAKN